MPALVQMSRLEAPMRLERNLRYLAKSTNFGLVNASKLSHVASSTNLLGLNAMIYHNNQFETEQEQ